MSDVTLEPLLDQCRSGEPARIVDAVQRLIELRAYAAVPTLIDVLRSPNAVVRCTIAGALAVLGKEDPATASAALLELLGDSEAIVRSEAADALGILGHVPAAERLRSLLVHDPEPLVRASAAETLGDLGDARALAELERAARDDDDEAVRGYAANSLGLLGDEAMLPRLEGYARSERSPRVRVELHGARYRLGAAEDLGALLALLDGADADLAANILNVLGDLTRRRRPAALASGASRIRESVGALAQRIPLLSGDAEQILRSLSATDPH